MYGGCDRIGSREGKKSLRKTKIALNDHKLKKPVSTVDAVDAISAPAYPLVPTTHEARYLKWIYL